MTADAPKRYQPPDLTGQVYMPWSVPVLHPRRHAPWLPTALQCQEHLRLLLPNLTHTANLLHDVSTSLYNAADFTAHVLNLLEQLEPLAPDKAQKTASGKEETS